MHSAQEQITHQLFFNKKLHPALRRMELSATPLFCGKNISEES